MDIIGLVLVVIGFLVYRFVIIKLFLKKQIVLLTKIIDFNSAFDKKKTLPPENIEDMPSESIKGLIENYPSIQQKSEKQPLLR